MASNGKIRHDMTTEEGLAEERAALKAELKREILAELRGDLNQDRDLNQEIAPENAETASDLLPFHGHKFNERSPFFGLNRGEEVFRIYRIRETRTRIGRALKARCNADLWDLILEAIDGGVLTPNDIVVGHDKLTLRVLFPQFPPRGNKSYWSRFDLSRAEDRKQVREEILPVLIAHKDAIIADPHCLETLVRKERNRRYQAGRVEKALAELPKGETHVVMFGFTLWPRIEERNGEYDFEQLTAAIWYFRDLDAFLIGHPDAHSRAIQIRYSTKWFDNYFSHITDGDVRRKIRGVFQLVHWLTVLMENNPVGECRPPPMPVID